VRKYHSKLRSVVLEGLFWLLAVLHLYPVILILLSALKTKSELAVNPFGFPQTPTLEHFITAFSRLDYFRSFFNTTVVTFLSMTLILFFSSASAYAIARKNNKLYNAAYLFFLAGMIVPFQMTMIPLYKLIVNMGWINTYQGIISINVATHCAVSIFIMTGFVKTVPKELEEASYIDGSGIYRTYFQIILPLLIPALATVAILNIFGIWNEFLLPLLFLPGPEMQTLVVKLSGFFGEYNNNWPPLFAAIFYIVYPIIIIYIYLQRYIVKGITAGSVKS
jgi:raffinose/stachyose/melibiose transport system permease protein